MLYYPDWLILTLDNKHHQEKKADGRKESKAD